MDLRLTIILSVWIHILGLAMLRYAPPITLPEEKPPLMVEVEIDASIMEEFKKADINKAGDDSEKRRAGTIPEKLAPPAPEDEETLSLESKEPKYLSYLYQIKSKIRRAWTVPAQVQQSEKGGKLLTIFTLDNQGRLLNVLLAASSGQAHLDKAAIEAVQRAAPFDPFPDHIKLKRLNIKAFFDYRIEYVGVK